MKLKAWSGGNWDTEVSEIIGFDGFNWASDTQRVKAWNGSAWVEIWNRSSPLTVGFYPSWTASYAGPGSSPAYTRPAFTIPNLLDTLMQGDWQDVGVSGTGGDWHGVMNFNPTAIRTAFAGRTVVSSATLRLTNRVSSEPSGTPANLYQVSSIPTSEPSTYNVGGSRSVAKIGPLSITDGATGTFGNTSQLRTWVASILAGGDHGFCLFDPVSNPLFRGYFYGTDGSSSQKPLLTITADYV